MRWNDVRERWAQHSLRLKLLKMVHALKGHEFTRAPKAGK
jgi:hypothetical protein